MRDVRILIRASLILGHLVLGSPADLEFLLSALIDQCLGARRAADVGARARTCVCRVAFLQTPLALRPSRRSGATTTARGEPTRVGALST